MTILTLFDPPYTPRHRLSVRGRLALAWSRLNCRLAGVTR